MTFWNGFNDTQKADRDLQPNSESKVDKKANVKIKINKIMHKSEHLSHVFSALLSATGDWCCFFLQLFRLSNAYEFGFGIFLTKYLSQTCVRIQFEALRPFILISNGCKRVIYLSKCLTAEQSRWAKLACAVELLICAWMVKRHKNYEYSDTIHTQMSEWMQLKRAWLDDFAAPSGSLWFIVKHSVHHQHIAIALAIWF